MLQYHSQPNKLEYLDISLIRTDGGTQSRASLNSKVIDEYAQALAEGKELPPVTVFYDGNTYWLADGFHRLEAAKKISSQTIAVDVRQGTRREAVLYSVGANALHGLRRSNIDKRRSVLTLLSDAEWSKWSNSQIAKQCAVDEGLVRKLKAELTSDNTKLEPTYAKKCGVDEATLKEVEQNIEAQTSERTVCRQGTTYTLNATNIGKHGKQTFTTNETTPFKENFEAKSVKTSSTSTPFGIQLENQCEPKTINRLNQVSGKQNSSDPGQAERLLNGEVMVQPESSWSTEFVVGDDLQSKNYVEEGVQVQCELENLFFIADSKEQKPQRMGRINKILEMNEDIIKVVVDHVDMQTYMDNLQSLSGLKHRGVTVWFTGLSGAGKSTISQMVGKELRMQGYKVEILDGVVVRQNLSKGLGFSREDRDQNVRRIGFVADLLTRNGVIVLVSVISPYCETRQQVRQQIGDFVEVYVNAPLEVCEQRDVKGLYKKAREGKIKNFTGIDDLYEPPLDPEVECRTDLETPMESTLKVLAKLKNLGL